MRAVLRFLRQWRTRQLLKRFGVSLLQAAIFGTAVGGVAYFRLPRGGDPTGSAEPTLFGIRAAVERWELQSLDWRLKARGAASSRSDEVVLVAIDEETMANARKDPRPRVYTQPWSRELIGGLIREIYEEGAKWVLVDLPLADARTRGEDEALKGVLDAQGTSSVLSFEWGLGPVPSVGASLAPFLFEVARVPTIEATRAPLRRVLASHHAGFVVPDGDGHRVLLGAESEEDASEVARSWQLKSAGPVQELSLAERGREVRAQDLFVSLAEVRVTGLDPAKLIRVRSLEHPAAAFLGSTGGFGAVTGVADLDGRLRAVPHFVLYASREGEAHVLPSLALAAALRVAGSQKLELRGGILEVGGRFAIPIDERGFSILRWDSDEAGADGRGTLKRTVSARRVLGNFLDREAGLARRYENNLEGKVVILANTAGRNAASYETPVGSGLPRASVWGQALVNLMKSEGTARADPRLDLGLTFGLAFMGAFLALSFSGGIRSKRGALVYFSTLLVASVVYAQGAKNLFVETGLWVAVACPLLAMGLSFFATTLYVFRTEQEIRDFVGAVLGRYLNPEIERQLSEDLSLIRPDRRPVTVCFAELERFNAMADRLDPETLRKLVKEYLNEFTQVVLGQAGQVERSFGDRVMGFWGAPARTEAHADQACEAALQLRELLVRKRAAWEAVSGQPFDVRLGVASGEAVVGDLGSPQKPNYTVAGQVVSIAQTLERANQGLGTRILVARETAEAAAAQFVFREVDRVQRPDGTAWVPIFELVGRRFSVSAGRTILLGQFERALSLFRERSFSEALDLFVECSERFGDPVATLYVERCRRFLVAPPEEGWGGDTGPAAG